MSYKIITIPSFEKELKKLSKKYPSLKNEYIELVLQLKEEPEIGTSIGHHCYKIRLAIASKGKGKSGGHGLLHLFRFCKIRFTYFLFTINQKKKIFLIKN